MMRATDDNSVPFRLDVEKTIQAVGVLLRSEPDHRMNYMRLIKLLYLADRRALQKTGKMITGDRVVAMERGPVLSGVYNLIRGEHIAARVWDEFIERDEYNIRLTKRPDVEKLSRFEIETLQRVLDEFRSCDEWDMVRHTHELEEWKRNDPGSSSKPIPLRDILDAVGLGDRADEIINEAAKQTEFDAFFAKHACDAATPSS